MQQEEFYDIPPTFYTYFKHAFQIGSFEFVFGRDREENKKERNFMWEYAIKIKCEMLST